MEHSAAFGGGQGDCWEIASRFFCIFQPGSNCRGHCPTVRGCSPSTPLAFQRLVDFRGFRPLRKSDVPIAFKGRRKRQKSTKVGHSGCYRLPRSRLCDYLRQSTKHAWSFYLRDKRNTADARPWAKVFAGCPNGSVARMLNGQDARSPNQVSSCPVAAELTLPDIRP